MAGWKTGNWKDQASDSRKKKITHTYLSSVDESSTPSSQKVGPQVPSLLARIKNPISGSTCPKRFWKSFEAQWNCLRKRAKNQRRIKGVVCLSQAARLFNVESDKCVTHVFETETYCWFPAKIPASAQRHSAIKPELCSRL